jgi:PAS domain S-box-containing protein
MKDRKVTKHERKDQPDRLRHEPTRVTQLESEQKRVAKALHRSETLFRKLTEKSIVGVYLIQDGLFRYVNPNMASIYGYDVDDLVDKRGPKDTVFEEDWPLVEESIRKRLSGEVEAVNYRFRGVRRSGEVFHQEVYSSRTDYRGRPAVIGTLLDITSRVEAERNMEMQLQKFQVLYHIAVAMAAERTLEEKLAVLVDKCRELLGTDVALVAVSDELLKSTLAWAQSGLNGVELSRLPLGFLRRQLFHDATGIRGDQVESCFTMLKRACRRISLCEDLSSGMAIPLRTATKPIGVLCVGSRSKRYFSESEKDIIALVGNIAALEITRKRAEEALARSEDQLRYLSTQLLQAQEVTRKRLARELHDGIGQSLSAIKFKIETVMTEVRGDSGRSYVSQLETLVPMIQSTVEEVQRIAVDLRPFMLDDLGLVVTFNWFMKKFQSTYSSIRIGWRVELREQEVPESLKIVIFRIAQEALNNVARHSKAEQVSVVLKKRRDRIELIIRDNGVGIEEDSVGLSTNSTRGFGLASMKERTELSGGVFWLDTRPCQGTSITASWPFKAAAPLR